jgi:hypothetical protein
MRAVLLVALITATAAAAEPNPYLNQAKSFQEQLDFEKCLRRLEQASRFNGNTKGQLAEIELYSGLCEAGLGHETEASEHFELGLQLNPYLELPPQQGPKITSLFKKAKDKLPPPSKEELKEPPAAPPPQHSEAVVPAGPPPAPPPATTTIEPAKTTHLGVPLGILAVGAVMLGSGVALGVVSKNMADAAHMQPKTMFEMDVLAQLQQAQTLALVSNVLFAVAGAALIGAVAAYFGLN